MRLELPETQLLGDGECLLADSYCLLARACEHPVARDLADDVCLCG